MSDASAARPVALGEDDGHVLGTDVMEVQAPSPGQLDRQQRSSKRLLGLRASPGLFDGQYVGCAGCRLRFTAAAVPSVCRLYLGYIWSPSHPGRGVLVARPCKREVSVTCQSHESAAKVGEIGSMRFCLQTAGDGGNQVDVFLAEQRPGRCVLAIPVRDQPG